MVIPTTSLVEQMYKDLLIMVGMWKYCHKVYVVEKTAQQRVTTSTWHHLQYG